MIVIQHDRVQQQLSSCHNLMCYGCCLLIEIIFALRNIVDQPTPGVTLIDQHVFQYGGLLNTFDKRKQTWNGNVTRASGQPLLLI